MSVSRITAADPAAASRGALGAFALPLGALDDDPRDGVRGAAAPFGAAFVPELLGAVVLAAAFFAAAGFIAVGFVAADFAGARATDGFAAAVFAGAVLPSADFAAALRAPVDLAAVDFAAAALAVVPLAPAVFGAGLLVVPVFAAVLLAAVLLAPAVFVEVFFAAGLAVPVADSGVSVVSAPDSAAVGFTVDLGVRGARTRGFAPLAAGADVSGAEPSGSSIRLNTTFGAGSGAARASSTIEAESSDVSSNESLGRGVSAVTSPRYQPTSRHPGSAPGS